MAKHSFLLEFKFSILEAEILHLCKFKVIWGLLAFFVVVLVVVFLVAFGFCLVWFVVFGVFRFFLWLGIFFCFPCLKLDPVFEQSTEYNRLIIPHILQAICLFHPSTPFSQQLMFTHVILTIYVSFSKPTGYPAVLCPVYGYSAQA